MKIKTTKPLYSYGTVYTQRVLLAFGLLSFLLISVFASLFTSPTPALAATSSTLNFQGRLYTSSGSTVPDGYYNVQFKLYDGGTSGGPGGTGQANAGTNLWTESYYDSNGVTAGNDNRLRVVNGYFSANLGSQTAFPGTINWDQELWLTMNVGGTTQTATPTYDGEMLQTGNTRTKLTGVPYAFRAGAVTDASGNAYTADNLVQLAPGTVQSFSSANTGIRLNQTGAGNLIQLQDSGTDVVTVGNTGSATFQNSSNSTTAFQIQSAAGVQLFNVDTTNSNLITNGSIEINATGWAADGASTVSRTTSTSYIGSASLQVTTTAAANDGAKFNVALSSSTQYTFSVFAKLSSGTFGTFEIGRSENGSSETSCSTALSVTTSGWQIYNCTFTTGATSGTTYIYVKQTDATSRTFYVDGAQLFANANVQAYREGSVALNGNITSPVVFRNTENSNRAFMIQNASGSTNVITVDTINNRLGVGVSGPAQALDVNGNALIRGQIQATGNAIGLNSASLSAAYFYKSYTAGTGGVSANDVVVLDSTGSMVDTTTARDSRVVGVSTGAVAAASTGSVAIAGNSQVNATTNGGANPIAIGDQLVTSTTSGAVMADNNATTGILGYAASTLASGTGTISVTVRPVGGQYAPIFRNASNSTSAFQIQDASGTSNLFVADTTNTRIGIGASPANGLLTVGTGTTTAAGGIYFGTDSNLYRSAASTLKTDGDFVVNGNLNVGASGAMIQCGSACRARIGTASDFGAYLNVAGGTTSRERLILRGVASQTADYLAIQDASGNAISGFNSSGNLYVGKTGTQTGNIVLYNTSNTGSITLTPADPSTNNYTLTLPAETGTVCTTATTGVCATAGTGFVQLGPASAQADGTTNSSININKTGASGSLLTLQKNGTTIASIGNTGAALFQNSTDSTTAFQIQNAAGSNLFTIDSINAGNISLLNNNGGQTSSWVTNSSTGLVAREGAVSVTLNGYAYVISGLNSAGTGQTTVYYAKLNADGSIGNWATTSALGGARIYAGVAAYGSYVYVIGGSTNGSAANAQSTVYYAKANQDGTLGTWTAATNDLSGVGAGNERHGLTAAAYNGYLYALGGRNTGGSYMTTTYYSKLNADGTPGVWATTNALNSARAGQSSFIANGYLYAIAGNAAGGTRTDTIQYSRIGTDGTLGAWTNQGATNPIPATREGGAAGVINGYAYYVGGFPTGSASDNNVYYAQLASDGSIGSWTAQSTNLLPDGMGDPGFFVANGRFYITTGYGNTGSDASAAVYYASGPRVTVGGSLDLVSLSGENLNEGGSGGTLTAGNTNVIGTFNVQDQANFNSSIYARGNLTVNGGALFQSSTNSTTAFQIQNAAGTSLFQVDTSGGDVRVGSGANNWLGGNSLNVSGGIATNDNFTFVNSGTGTGAIRKYIATSGTVNGSDVVILNTSNQVAQTTTGRDIRVYGVAQSPSGGFAYVVTYGYALVNYDTGSTVPSAGDQLVTSSVAGQVTVDNNATTGILGRAVSNGSAGTVYAFVNIDQGQYSPTFRNASDSTAAFQIQNAAGSQMFNLNSSTGRVTVSQGGLTVSGLLNPATPTLSSSGVGGTLAAATYYYRVAARGPSGETRAMPSSPSSVTTTGSTSTNTVSWSAVTYATGYRVYRSLDNSTWFYNDVGSGVSSLVDNGSTYTWGASGSPNLLANNTGNVLLAPDSILDFTNGAGNASVSYDTGGNSLQIGNYYGSGVIQIQADTFYVQDTTGYNSNLTIANTGAVTLKNRVDSTAALRIQEQNGNSFFTADSTNRQIILGKSSTYDGKLQFKSVSNTGSITLAPADPSTNNYTLTLPAETGTVCTTATTGVCATAGTGFVQLGPASAQADGTTNSSININKTGASGNILTLQNSGTTVASLGKTGAALFQNSTDSTTAFQIQNAAGASFVAADSTNSRLLVGSAAANVAGETLTIKTGNAYGFVQTNGSTTVGSYADASVGWYGTKSNSNLAFFTNDQGAAQTIYTNGSVLFKNYSNGTTAFEVQNSSGTDLFNIDSTNSNINIGKFTDGGVQIGASTTNIVTNPSFESGTSGWSSYWSGILSQSSFSYAGQKSLQVVTVGANGNQDGAQWTLPGGLSTGSYTLSFWAKVATTANDLEFAIEGATSSGSSTQNVGTSWKRYTTSFTVSSWTGGNSSNAKIRIREATDNASAITFYVDAVQLEANNVASGYTEGTRLTGNTSINQALDVTGNTTLYSSITAKDVALFQNSTNTTTAFQIQNASGVSQFTADTTNGGLTLGSTSGTGTITVGQSTASNTINIGTAIGAAATQTINIGTSAIGSSITTLTLGSLIGTSATTIQSGSGNITMQAAGTSTIGVIQVGAGGAGSTTPDYLALDVKSTTGDPAGGAEGYMYYNTFDNKFRCYQGAAWTDCIGSGGTTTLQNAYDNDVDGSDSIITLSTADDGIIIRNPAASGSDSTYNLTIDQLATGTNGGLSIQSAGTGNLLLVTDTTATAKDVLTIADKGWTTFKTQTDGTGSFQVQNAAGTNLFRVDTTNSRLFFGGNSVYDAANDKFAIGTATPDTAKLYVTTGSVGLRINETSTNYILQLQNTGTDVARVAYDGSTLFQNSANSTTAFQIQSASAASLFNVDSTQAGAISILGNNSGDLRAWTTNGSNLSVIFNDGVVVSANGYIYTIGGQNTGGTVQDDYQYAKLNANGSVGTFTNVTTNQLPAVRWAAGGTVANGYIYIVGGSSTTSTANGTGTVYYAKINTDGTLGTWQTNSNTLSTCTTTAVSGNTVVASKGYIYTIGGMTTASATITGTCFAKLNADGSTGAWSNTNALPGSRAWGGSTVANGYIYVVGGCDTNCSSSNVDDDTYYGLINPTTGAVTWSTDADLLPANRSDGSVVAANGYLYYIAGDNVTASQDDVYYSALNSDGSISAWTTDTDLLPANRSGGGLSGVMANGYIYYLGGQTGGTGQNNVYYTSTARLTVGGSLDLVGLSGENLAEGGSGGSLTAGDTSVLGDLYVSNDSVFRGNIISNGTATFRNNADSASAFAVQNAAGTNQLTVDTSNSRVDFGNSAGTNYLRVSTTNASIYAQNSSAFNSAITLQQNGDSNARYALYYTGGQELGSGSSARDIAFTRSAAGVLQIYSPSNVGPATLQVRGSTAQSTTDLFQIQTSTPTTVFSVGSTGAVLSKNTTDSGAAFQIQNAAGTNTVFNADTTTNLVTNAGIETNTTGWSAMGGATISRTFAQAFAGSASLQIDTTAAANDGVKYPLTLTSNTTYTISIVAKITSGSFSTFQIGRADDGATDTACGPSQTVTTTGWTRYICTVVTGTVSGSPYIYFKQTDATARTFYIDDAAFSTRAVTVTGTGATDELAVEPLAQAASATAYVSLNGGRARFGYDGASGNAVIQAASSKGVALRVNGSSSNVFSLSNTGAALFQNLSNSTTGFQIQNDVGTSNLFVADTSNTRIGIGTAAPTVQFEVKQGSGTGTIANFRIEAATADVRIGANAGQAAYVRSGSGDTLSLSAADGTDHIKINTDGSVTFKNTTDSTTGFKVTNAAGTSYLNVDTSNQKVTSGSLDVGTVTGNRIFTDNFEAGNLNLWGTQTGSVSADTTTPFSGKYSGKIAPTASFAYAERQFTLSSSTIYARGYVYVASASSKSTLFSVYNLTDGFAASELSVYRQAGGNIAVYSGALTGGVGGDCVTGGALSTGAWHKIMMKVVLSNTGSCEVTVDDGTPSTSGSVDTLATNNPTRFSFGSHSGAETTVTYVDELAVDTVALSNTGSLTAQDTLHVGGTSTFSGIALFQPAANYADAFQIRDPSGNVYFNGDATQQTLTLGGTGQVGTLTLGRSTATNTISIGSAIGGSATQTINIGTSSTASSTTNINIGSSIAGTTAITGPTTVTNRTSGSSDTFNVSNSTSTGTIAKFSDNATAVLTIADGGASTFRNQSDSTAGFIVQNASGTSLLNADTTNLDITVGGNLLVSKSSQTNQDWSKVSGTAGTVGGNNSSINGISASISFNGNLYVGTEKANAAEIYRYDGSNAWTLVSQSGGTGQIASGGTSGVDAIQTFAVYNGSLYVGTKESGTGQAEVYRYDGGTTWTKVSGTAGTIGGNPTTAITAVNALVVYNGQLYAGTEKSNSAEVYVYNGGSTWTKASGAAGTIGTASIDGVKSMVVHNGQLYLGTTEPNQAEIYRFDGGTTWTEISDNTTSTGKIKTGGTGSFNYVQGLVSFNGSLYAGTSKTDGAEVYRWDGTPGSWTVVSSGTAGTITASGTSTVDGADSLTVYNGSLYLGTYTASTTNQGEIYRYAGSGSTWTKISQTSPGTIANGGTASIDEIQSLTVHNGSLYAGTFESTAAEIYRYSDNLVEGRSSDTAGVFTVGASGTASFQNSANTTMAFNIQNTAGDSLFSVDSTNAGNITLLGNNGGEIKPWKTTTSLPGNNTRGSTVFANGYVYLVGGDNAGVNLLATAYYAKVNSDGTIGSWTATTSMPNFKSGFALTYSNGYIYALGGAQTTSSPTAEVFYAKVNSNGTLGTWQTGTSLPSAVYSPAAVAYGGYMYVMGGDNAGGTVLADVISAKINNDGSLGNWTDLANDLPATRYYGTPVVLNGYVYYIGGMIINDAQNNVYSAKLNSDGTVGTWTTLSTNLPVDTRLQGMGTSNGYIYIYGGDDGLVSPTVTSSVYYAKAITGGGLAAWQTSTRSLPAARAGAAWFSANGYIYSVGGNSTTGVSDPKSDVYYAATARVSLGASLDLVGISGDNLAEGGTGGSLTAGNTQVVGSLQVQDQASFWSGLYVRNDAGFGGNLTIGSQTDASSSTFQAACGCITNNVAGTFGAAGADTGRDGVFSSAVYNGKLYISTIDSAGNNSGIYRYDGKSNVSGAEGWTLITNAVGKIVAGDAVDIDASVLTVYNGKLYAGTQTGTTTGGVYAYDGTSWTQINTTRGTIGADTTVEGVDAMTVWNGKLYIVTRKTDSAGIYRYDGGTAAGGNFTRLNATLGKGLAEATATIDGGRLISYGGNLWWGTVTSTTNTNTASLYKYDGNTFTLMNTTAGTFASGTATVDDVTSLAVYNDQLFVGTRETNLANIYVFKGGYDGGAGADVFYKTTTTSGRIDATNDATDVDSVTSMTVYNGRLYAGTETSGLAAIYEYTGISTGSTNGWTIVNSTRGRFGAQTSSDFVRTMSVYNNTLYVGVEDTASTNGAMYFFTKTSGNSFALQFDSGSSNTGGISFVGSQQVAGNLNNTGSFLFTHGISSSAGAYDIAEDYPTRDDSLKPGNLVSIDTGEKGFVRKTTQKGDSTIVGIYSENPGFRLSQKDDNVDGARAIPVALAGRVPVNVTDENGPILPGDYLTSSSTPGFAMKATKNGPTIGKALEGFDGTGQGRISVFVNVSTYTQSQNDILQGDQVHAGLLSVQGNGNIGGNLNVAGDIQIGGGLTVTGDVHFEGNLAVDGNISVKNITVAGHIITVGDAPQVDLAEGVVLGANTGKPVVTIEGNDTSGTVTIDTKDLTENVLAGDLVEVKFTKSYDKIPKVFLEASNEEASDIQIFRDVTTEKFVIKLKGELAPDKKYKFDYFTVE